MDTAQFRLKLLRRILSPVELLYDLTMHWFIIILGIALGTLFMVGKLSDQPIYFESDATMVLSPARIALDPEDSRRISRPDSNFIVEQINLLQSDSVLEKVVKEMGPDSVLDQEDDIESQAQRRSLPGMAYRYVSESLSSLAEKIDPPPQALSIQDAKIQRAIASFQRRSQVLNDRRASIVRLKVYGVDPRQVKRELDMWIAAYRTRIRDISEDTFNGLFKAGMDNWGKKEKEARQILAKYQSEHPEVTPGMKRYLEEKIIRLGMLRDDFIRGELLGIKGPTLGGLSMPEDEYLSTLKKKNIDLEIEIMAQESKGVPETNVKLQDMKSERDRINEKIKHLEILAAGGSSPMEPEGKEVLKSETGPVVSGASGSGNLQSDITKRPSKKESSVEAKDGSTGINPTVAKIEAEIKKTIEKLNEIEGKLAEVAAITEDQHRAAEVLQRYKVLYERREDQAVVQADVDVQVLDPGQVPSAPLPRRFVQKLALGPLYGGVVAFCVAFGIEFFSRKIRFKRDVEEDLGLRVVGVVP